MRKAIVVAVLALVALVAVFLLARGGPPPAEATAEATPPGTVVIRETPPPARGARVLEGRVSLRGAPVSGASIRASDPSGSAFTHRPCSCQDHCGNELLQCWCIHAAQTLAEAAAKREGDEPLLALATSGSDGAFQLEGLPDGPITLWAEVPGKLAARPLTVDGAATAAELVLEPGVEIHGSVAEEQRKLPNVKVSLLDKEHPRWFEAITDAQGAFHFSHLPPGAYTAIAAPEGKLPTLSFANAGAEETLMLIDAPRTVEVVVLEDGAPARGAKVLLSENHRHLEAVSDADGKASFQGLRPNELYRVEAELRGLQAMDSARPADSRPVELELTRTATVSGVVSRDGQPVAKATVYTQLGMMRVEAHTDESGHYQLKRLMPGFHRLGALHEKIWMSKEKQLALGLGAQATADFELEKRPAVTGVVVDAGGAPAPKTFVYLWSGPFISGFDVTADDGTFALMAEGDVELTASGPRGSHKLQVHAPAEVTVRLGGGPTLTATVRDERGEPVEGAEVRVTPKDFKPKTGFMVFSSTGEVATALTGRDGVAVVDNLDDGELVAQAFCKPVGLGSSSKPVNVTIAGKPASLELTVERGLAIEGLVETPRHAPLGEVKVTARPKQRGGQAETLTGADGRFSFAGVSPGAYMVMVAKEGFFSRRGYAEVTAGAKEVRFELEPGKRYTGRVVSEGQPVTRFVVNNREVANPGGQYELVAEPGGSAPVEISAPGFVSQRRSLDVPQDGELLPEIELERGRTIKVTVLDADTRLPLAGVSLMAEMQLAQTGSSGQATFSSVPSKRITVRASMSDDAHGPGEVTLTETQSTAQLLLPAAAKLTGKVVDANGAPVENERLTASTPDRTQNFGTISGHDGTFALNSLAAGHYRVKLDEEPDSTPAVEVELETGGSAQVVLKKQRLVTVQLTVNDPLNRRQTDAFLVPGSVPFPEDGDVSALRAGSTSLWRGRVRVPEGHYTLIVMLGQFPDPGSGGFAQPVDLRLPSAELAVTAPAQLTRYRP